MTNLITQHGSEHQQRVAQFMRLAGQAVPNTFTVPDVETRRLRARLILEEALETIEALGFSVHMTLIVGSVDIAADDVDGLEFIEDKKFNPIEVIDGCCDLDVVSVAGTLAALGLPDLPFLAEVDKKNLEKGAGHRDPQTGKWIKPADWTPPDIAGVLSKLTGGG